VENAWMCAASVPIFQSLSIEELHELGQSMHHKTYRKGQVIAVSGDPVEYLMIVASGRLNLVHTSSSGREQVVRTVGPHESLGELALFAQSVFEGDLICAENASVCLLHRNSVQNLGSKRDSYR
jgi:CRP-like cAMP-binding protein